MRLRALLAVLLLAACDPPPNSAPESRGTRGDPFGSRARATAGRGAVAYRRAHALVVGVSRYASPSLGALKGTAHDATEVAALLGSRYGMSTTLLVDRENAPVTRARLLEALAALKKDVGREDALLFYYAGHGVPGRLAPADAEPSGQRDPGAWKNLLSYAELAAALRACDAHHTLVVLDCCFSGSALAEGAPARDAVGVLGEPALRVAEGDENLARVFNRRAFQVLTAGTGEEEVDDLAKVSKAYGDLEDLEKHSPFTGALLQGLRGLTGRPDGRVLASDLGYYLSHTLVHENDAFKAKQAPRFGALGGGDGDFLFLPVQRVLNPRLVVPLYMSGADYAELRASAADALADFVEAAPEKERAELAGAVATHLVRLFRDAQTQPRKAGARTARKLAALSPELARCVPGLTSIVAGQALDDEEKDLAARALGALAAHADAAAVAAASEHLDQLRLSYFERIHVERFGDMPRPKEVQARLQAFEGSDVDPAATWPEKMRRAEAERAAYVWALSDGLEIYRRLDRAHQEGRAFLEKAEKSAAETSFFEARQAAGAAVDLLWPESPEWTRGQELLRSTPDLRPLWTAGPLAQHAAPIRRMALSGDGRRLASCDAEGTIRWWNVESGALAGELRKRAPDVVDLVLSRDGRRLVWALSWGGLVRWNLDAERKEAETRMLRGVRSLVALDDAAGTVAVGMLEGVIGLIDPAEPEKAVYLREAGQAVTRLAAHRGTHTLVSYGDDRRLRYWDLATHKERAAFGALFAGDSRVDTLTAHEGLAEVFWSGESGTLGSASLTDAPSPRAAARAPDPPYRVALSPDGRTLVLAMANVGIQAAAYPGLEPRWVNASTVAAEGGHLEKTKARFEPRYHQPPVCFSPDGARLWVARGASVVQLDAATGLQPGSVLHGPIAHASYAPDGRAFLSSGARLLRWEGNEHRPVDHPGQPGAAAWMYPDGRRVLAVLDRGLFCLDSGKVRWQTALDVDARVRLSRDGRDVAVALEKNVTVLDGETGQVRKTWSAPFPVRALALHPGGRLAAIGGSNGGAVAALVDLASGRELWRRGLGEGQASASALAFDPWGQHLAAGDEKGRLLVWRTRTGEPVEGLGAKDLACVRDLAFSGDGTLLAAAGRQVRVWDVKNRKERARFSPSIPGTISAAFSPDGRSILAAGVDGGLSLWSLGLSLDVLHFEESARQVGVSPAGDVFVAISGGRLNVRSVDTGELVAEAPAEFPQDLTFSRDGLRMAVVDARRIGVYETRSLRKLFETPADHGAISPDGESVVALRAHEGVILGLDGKERGAFRGLKGANLKAAAFVLDGAVLSGDDTGEVRFWSPGQAEARRFAPPTGNGITHIAASPDGRRVVAAGGRSPVLLFDFGAQNSRRLGPVREKALTTVEFSSDGLLLLLCWNDGAGCVWNVERDAARTWFWSDEDPWLSLSWHPDGIRLFGPDLRRRGIRVFDHFELDRARLEPEDVSRSLRRVETLPFLPDPRPPAESALGYRDLDAALALGVEGPARRVLDRRLEREGAALLGAGLTEAARRRFEQAKCDTYAAMFGALDAIKAGRWADAGPLLENARGLSPNKLFLLRVAAARRTKDVEGEKALRQAFKPEEGYLAGVVRFAKLEGPSGDALKGGWPPEVEGEIHAYLALLGEAGHAEEARKLLKAESLELELLRP